MNEALTQGFLALAAIVAAVIAGVFLMFSDFGMRSFQQLNPEAGIHTMQFINRNVQGGSLFGILLFGLLGLSLVLIIGSFVSYKGLPSVLIIIGFIVYLLGVGIVSFIFNVPMNGHLEAMNSADPEAQQYWLKTYLPDWTFWNHIRVVASLLTAGSFGGAFWALTSASVKA